MKAKPSPFPGMDPYLEGSLWSDVHQELSSTIREQLAPKVAPKYTARLETYTIRDTGFAEDIGIMYPDVGVFSAQKTEERRLPQADEGDVATEVLTVSAPTLELPQTAPELRIPVLEIRDVKQQRLVTCIELLSPANKRQPALDEYRAKREALQKGGVNILEIDLIRRGVRPLQDARIPASDYQASLYRVEGEKLQIWAFDLSDKLPVLPVPLLPPDTDVALDLPTALATAYQRGMYHLSINYEEPPPPPEVKK